MWPSRPCWRSSALEQHLVTHQEAHRRLLDPGERRSPGTSTTSPALLGYGAQCYQPLSGPGVPSRGTGIMQAAGQGPLRRSGRLQQRHPSRHRENRLQDGHFHHPVLPVRPDLRVPSASTRPWWTSTSPTPSAVWSGIGSGRRSARTVRVRATIRSLRPPGTGRTTPTLDSAGTPQAAAAAATRKTIMYNPQTIHAAAGGGPKRGDYQAVQGIYRAGG